MSNNASPAPQFAPFSIPIDSAEEFDQFASVLDAAQRHLGLKGTGLIAVWARKIGGAQLIAAAAKDSISPALKPTKRVHHRANGKGKGADKHPSA